MQLPGNLKPRRMLDELPYCWAPCKIWEVERELQLCILDQNFWFSVFFDNSNDQLCVLSACVCVALLCLRVCVCVYICVSQCWYMSLNDSKSVRVCVLVCVCELSEQEEWFHLDLIHLGGNLLVNRLVHELRRVDLGLFVCNIACGQFSFFRSPANTPTNNWQGAAKNMFTLQENVRPLYFLSFPDLENSHATLFAAFLAHMAKVPIVTILLPNWCNFRRKAILCCSDQCWVVHQQVLSLSVTPWQVLEFTMHLTTTMWSQSNDRVKNLLRLPPLCL